MQVEAPASALGTPKRVGGTGSPSAFTSHSEGQWYPDTGSMVEPDAPRATLGITVTRPWVSLAALTHRGAGPGPGGANKVIEEEI